VQALQSLQQRYGVDVKVVLLGLRLLLWLGLAARGSGGLRSCCWALACWLVLLVGEGLRCSLLWGLPTLVLLVLVLVLLAWLLRRSSGCSCLSRLGWGWWEGEAAEAEALQAGEGAEGKLPLQLQVPELEGLECCAAGLQGWGQVQRDAACVAREAEVAEAGGELREGSRLLAALAGLRHGLGERGCAYPWHREGGDVEVPGCQGRCCRRWAWCSWSSWCRGARREGRWRPCAGWTPWS
jgi:hypothetical protein